MRFESFFSMILFGVMAIGQCMTSDSHGRLESHSAMTRDALQHKKEKHDSLRFLHNLFGDNAAPPVAYRASIAVCIQGSAAELGEWIKMRSLMKTRGMLTYFLLSFDVPFEVMYPGYKGELSIYAPQSTWTSGRNMLLRYALNYENSKADLKFKYFLFADGDMTRMACDRITDCNPRKSDTPIDARTACCFDAVAYLLSSKIEYAIVSFFVTFANSTEGPTIVFSHYDCPDANLNAFHRDAVPTLLPYYEDLDGLTWWASQGIMFNVIAGCIPGYSIHAELFDLFELQRKNNHSNYPRGRDEFESNAKQKIFGNVGLCPLPLRCAELFEQGDCLQVHAPRDSSPFPGLSGNWRNSDAFKLCSAKFLPRFQNFLSTGNVSSL